MSLFKVAANGDRELVITREFNAPRSLVYDAWTKPELLKRWFGPPGWSLPVCEIDLRVGGTWRYLMRADDGAEMGLSGVYREIIPNERIVATEKFDQSWYEGDAVGTITFEEHGSRTVLRQVMRYDSAAVRDAVLKSPMEKGMAAGFVRMDDVLASLQNTLA